MKARTRDVNLLKVALLPVSILGTVALALSVVATTISDAVTTDTVATVQALSQPAAMVADNTANLDGGRDG